MTAIPGFVKIVEVGPRDGLQNEATPVASADKIALVQRLQDAGVREIEVTSFVSPKWVPQMADNAEVMHGIRRKPGVRYSVLTPNMQGYEAAAKTAPDEIVVFAAASEAFSQKNINCSIAESIERFRPVTEAARAACTTGAKRSMLSAIEQLMFFWLKASLAAPNTTISSGLDNKAASKPFMFGVNTE